MKTATIEQYHSFGTKNTEVADIKYRGKLIKRIIENAPQAQVVRAAVAWAKDNGFTHMKISYC